jgi:hypothetical protein
VCLLLKAPYAGANRIRFQGTLSAWTSPGTPASGAYLTTNAAVWPVGGWSRACRAGSLAFLGGGARPAWGLPGKAPCMQPRCRMALPTGLDAASGGMREERLWTEELTTGGGRPVADVHGSGVMPRREAARLE